MKSKFPKRFAVVNDDFILQSFVFRYPKHCSECGSKMIAQHYAENWFYFQCESGKHTRGGWGDEV